MHRYVPSAKHSASSRFTERIANPTLDQYAMNQLLECFYKRAVVFFAGLLLLGAAAIAQAPGDEPREKQPEKAAEKPAEPPNAAQIELLETKYRFETNGDSRKEVHALVKINSELGVRQFARLNFDYNRSFQSVEIPLAHITHANGGTSDILPSAITDAPNPAVEKFPAYHDVRVKSVRILGLQPGDSLEYRVITTTTRPPLAPDFWLDHSFERSGVVTEEHFEISVPVSREIHLYSSPEVPHTSSDESIDGLATSTYRWKYISGGHSTKQGDDNSVEADIALTTFETWQQLATRIWKRFDTSSRTTSVIREKETSIAGPFTENHGKDIETLYDFVSQKIRTVDLPLGCTGFRTRDPEEILSSGYGTQEDKFVLFAALSREAVGFPHAGLVSAKMPKESGGLARPSVFDHLLTETGIFSTSWWLDLNLEVAPYRMIPSQFRGKPALRIGSAEENSWRQVPAEVPYAAKQVVIVDATLLSGGSLKAKVKYNLRGDNELLLRVTFHKTPKEKQQEVAQYLALSDGFRGKVTSVKTSDPYDTEKPFEVEYELTQEKFVDWSKKPVRIPALLPLPGLPEAPKKQSDSAKIDLGPPLNIELSGTLRLPPGTTAQAPAGTSVKRDYATFSSEYSANSNLLRFSRHLNFLSQEIPGDRSVDLSAFLHAVQSDQSQLFVLDKPDSVPHAKPK